MKFIATTSNKLDSIPFVKGQMIFSKDNRTIYLDETERVEYPSVIVIAKEKTRLDLIPVSAFYFVEETAILWRYNDNQWTQITIPPSEMIVFSEKDKFPVQGKEKVIYIDGATSYIWSQEEGNYIQMNTQK